MVCLCNCLIAVGLVFASFLPPAAPLKPSPMPTNGLATAPSVIQTLQRSTISAMRGRRRGSQPSDLILGSVWQNSDTEHDRNRYAVNSLNGPNLGTTDASARSHSNAGPTAIRPKAPKAFDVSVKNHKFRHKRLTSSTSSGGISDGISQDMSQTKAIRRSVSSLSLQWSSNDNVNERETNEEKSSEAVPTEQTVDTPSGHKSISLSPESNGHRVREVISGTELEPIRSITQTFVPRSPVETVRAEIESQTSRGSNFASFPAGVDHRVSNRVDNSNNDRVKHTLGIVSNGIFWSKQLEDMTPKGFSLTDDILWSRLINSSDIVAISDGCGRMQNRLITLDSGMKSCARHRDNLDQIQGDIFSFYLARVMAIGNLPPATVTLFRSLPSGALDKRWRNVMTRVLRSHWSKPIVVTKYVDNLVPAFIPELLRDSQRRLHPTKEDLVFLNVSQLTELVQWSDLIIFDYLTANLDRVVNNMVNEKWNPEMMRRPAHNLLKVKDSGLLLFLDNESGLLHGYRLLKKYERHHQSMLSALCIFRERTARLIERLHADKSVVPLIAALFKNNIYDQKVFNEIPFLPINTIKVLNERVGEVYHQIENCKHLYKNNTIVSLYYK